jgi:hypothetical protein
MRTPAVDVAKPFAHAGLRRIHAKAAVAALAIKRTPPMPDHDRFRATPPRENRSDVR